MSRLKVKKLAPRPFTAAEIPALLDENGVAFQPLSCVNWPNVYPYKPRVAFRLAHTGSQLLLHYRVEEGSVAAVAADMGRVWEDSCCEFFVAPAQDGLYYNLETNCAGHVLLCCGPDRHAREGADGALLQTVGRWSSLGPACFAERRESTAWEMALLVPVAAFFRHDIGALSGQSWRANVYKCGDKLAVPHFLSWAPIDTPEPDFHRPEFFGEITFE